MRKINYIILMLICLGLQACASGRMAEELQSGKMSFERGDYKTAFHQLLPIAAEGDPQAQYAVGYMYYNGFGVTEDKESAAFWMNKSAQKNNASAIKALKLINYENSHPDPLKHPEFTSADSAHEPLKPEVEPSLTPLTTETLNSKYNKKENNKAENTINKSSPSLAASSAYAIQLMGSYKITDLENLQAKLHLVENTSTRITKLRGQDWFVLLYGTYPAKYQAELALTELSPELRQMKPWVRSFASLRV